MLPSWAGAPGGAGFRSPPLMVPKPKSAKSARSARSAKSAKWTRLLRYQVASSLDGYIAGPRGEADWIVGDPDIDFAGLFAQFDTFLIGRRTYEAMVAQGHGASSAGRTFVFSRTLDPARHPRVTVVADRVAETVAALKAERTGKDIWLFGGGELFRSLAALGLVDRVEIAIVPVLLGGGIPLFPSPANRTQLELDTHRVYPKSGISLLGYRVAT
jgi:dihydrofolate reductase